MEMSVHSDRALVDATDSATSRQTPGYQDSDLRKISSEMYARLSKVAHPLYYHKVVDHPSLHAWTSGWTELKPSLPAIRQPDTVLCNCHAGHSHEAQSSLTCHSNPKLQP